MKEKEYREFSLKIHKKNWRFEKPNVCQFELTFRCDLHCRHCYTDCYNNPSCIEKELNTEDIKYIVDKVHNAGVVWVCFTGGDPLTRQDFLDIYTYAKKKGFIITVFTSGYSITGEVVRHFKKSPPFAIEITLNAVSQSLYEKISQVNGSFDRVMAGIDLILRERLPLRLKTEVTRDNLLEVYEIKKFIEKLGLRFRPSLDIHARLDGDRTPCNLRIPVKEAVGLNGIFRKRGLEVKGYGSSGLFRCAIGGGDGFHIDPYGNTFPCRLIRTPSINLLEVEVEYALNKLLSLVRSREFVTDSECRVCNIKELCWNCPGRAYLETGDMEAPLRYYCSLAKAIKNLSR